MLHYERLKRYYTFVGERLRRCPRHFSHMAAGASAGGAIALLAGLPLVVGPDARRTHNLNRVGRLLGQGGAGREPGHEPEPRGARDSLLVGGPRRAWG